MIETSTHLLSCLSALPVLVVFIMTVIISHVQGDENDYTRILGYLFWSN